jgi:hypothetical protein
MYSYLGEEAGGAVKRVAWAMALTAALVFAAAGTATARPLVLRSKTQLNGRLWQLSFRTQ